MSMIKESQLLEGKDIELSVDDVGYAKDSESFPVIFELDRHLPSEEELTVEDPEILLEDPTEVHISIDESSEEDEPIVFKLDKVPGALDQEDFEPADLIVEEPEEVEISSDPWDWKGDLKGVVKWVYKMLQSIPKHTGRDTAGLERAISYLEALDREISKAVKNDIRDEIGSDGIEALERAREEIQDGIERLKDRLETIYTRKYKKDKKKNKKVAESNQDGLLKEAGVTKILGINISVPLFISTLGRLIINASVSNGKDLEDTYQKVCKKYKLAAREELELQQLLMDMGYPLRIDRGLVGDDFDPTSENNFELGPNYSA